MTETNPASVTIGILGSGQLGRMLAIAAAQLGLRTHVGGWPVGCSAFGLIPVAEE